MTEHDRKELTKGAESFAFHLVAIVVGAALTILGLGMGVTIVMLPIGVPVGLFGLMVFFWGLFAWNEKSTPAPPPG